MPLTPIQLSTRTAKSRNGFESAARLINCFSETVGQEAKANFTLYAINGLNSFATLTGASGGVRRMLATETELQVVAGRQLFSVSSAGDATLVGGITSDGLTTMARNSNENPQTVIVVDGLWYIYQSGVLTQGNDPDLPPPIYVTEKDGYFIFLAADGQFTISGINVVTIDGLDFATAEARSDDGVGLATRGNDLIVFGTRSTEFWQNTGNADFPFERAQFRNFGCYAAGSIAEVTALVQGSIVDSVVWCATDEKGAFVGVYLLNGYSANKISTYDIDRDIADDPSPQNIRSLSWSEDGHVFVAITGSTYTHVYDTVEGTWHERQSNGYSYWRPKAHASFAGNVVLGDSISGELYKSERSAFDESGSDMLMTVQLPIVHAFPYELSATRLILDAVPGVGISGAASHISDPVVMMDVSRDGGRNFGAVRHRNLGKEAQVLKQIEWNGLGDIPRQGATIRFRISASVRRALMGAAIEVERLAM